MFWLRTSAWLWSNRFSGNCPRGQFWPNLIIVAVNEGQVELLSQKSRHKDIVDEKILGGLLKEEVKWKEDLKVVSPWRRWQSCGRWEHQRHRRCCCSSPGRTSPQDQLHLLLLTWADNTLSNKKSDCFFLLFCRNIKLKLEFNLNNNEEFDCPQQWEKHSPLTAGPQHRWLSFDRTKNPRALPMLWIIIEKCALEHVLFNI